MSRRLGPTRRQVVSVGSRFASFAVESSETDDAALGRSEAWKVRWSSARAGAVQLEKQRGNGDWRVFRVCLMR